MQVLGTPSPPKTFQQTLARTAASAFRLYYTHTHKVSRLDAAALGSLAYTGRMQIETNRLKVNADEITLDPTRLRSKRASKKKIQKTRWNEIRAISRVYSAPRRLSL